MIKSTILFQILVIVIFFLLLWSPGQINAESIYFNIDKAVELAEQNDLELEGLKISLRELLRSKTNIYRSIFPKLKASTSGSKVIQQGETDTTSYTVGLSLEQLLYDQLSTPIKLKGYLNSIEENRLKIDQKEKEVEQKVTDLYLKIIFGEKRLKNSNEKIKLYEKFVGLMNLEYKVGSKTLVDVIEAEKNLLESRLEREELSKNIQISYRDLVNLLNLDSKNVQVTIDHDLKGIYRRVFKNNRIKSVNSLVEHIKLPDIENQEATLYARAVNNDFKLKKMKISLRNNSVKKKLSNLLWLKNISINCGVDFTGDRFFPVNRTYSIGASILFDFGFLAPDVSVSASNQPGNSTISGSGESEVFSSLAAVKKKNALNIEAHNIKRQIEDRERKIKRDIDVWFIKFNTLIEKYAIYSKQRQIIEKNEAIISLKRDIGEVKPVEYLQFMIEKKDFELKMEELSKDFISLSWEFESISNISIAKFLRWM